MTEFEDTVLARTGVKLADIPVGTLDDMEGGSVMCRGDGMCVVTHGIDYREVEDDTYVWGATPQSYRVVRPISGGMEPLITRALLSRNFKVTGYRARKVVGATDKLTVIVGDTKTGKQELMRCIVHEAGIAGTSILWNVGGKNQIPHSLVSDIANPIAALQALLAASRRIDTEHVMLLEGPEGYLSEEWTMTMGQVLGDFIADSPKWLAGVVLSTNNRKLLGELLSPLPLSVHTGNEEPRTLLSWCGRHVRPHTLEEWDRPFMQKEPARELPTPPRGVPEFL